MSETAHLDELKEQIVGIAERVRQQGYNSIRQELNDDLHPLLYSGLVAVMDGVAERELLQLLEAQSQVLLDALTRELKVISAGVRAIRNEANPRLASGIMESHYRLPGKLTDANG